MHRRAAELLHARGVPSSSVAHHLISCGQAGAPWAACVLYEAAEQALLDHDLERAVNCLELAHRSSVDEHDRAATRARLAHVESKLNPSTAARHLAPLVAAAGRDQLGHNDSLALIRQLTWHGRTDEAAGLLERIRSAPLTGIGDADLRDIELWLSCAHPPLAKRKQDSGHQLSQVAPGADPWLRSAAALADLLASGKSAEAVARAEQVLRALHLSRTSPWAEESAMLALLVLVYTDKLEIATEWCERLLAEARDQRGPTALALFSAVRAEIAVRQGYLADAVRLANDALTFLPPKAWGVAIGFPLGSLILAASRMGDFETAARHLSQAVPEAMYDSRWGLHYMHARGHYYLATNHYHAALANFRSCGELMRAWGLDIAGLVPWRTSAAESWIHLGNSDQARLLISDQLARPGIDGSRARGASLRLLAATSPPSRRLQLLTEALDLFESSGDRFEQARVLADFSRAYNALDQKRRARLLFRQAVHVANMCDAKPLYQELLQVSGDAGAAANSGESDRINSLTSSERRVASLAVMGYTNREIAAKLYITPSTVEQHLTRIFRKLDVKGRAELPVGLWAELTKAG
jgi:DNA-binding CsgD family transcriptional regulator